MCQLKLPPDNVLVKKINKDALEVSVPFSLIVDVGVIWQKLHFKPYPHPSLHHLFPYAILNYLYLLCVKDVYVYIYNVLQIAGNLSLSKPLEEYFRRPFLVELFMKFKLPRLKPADHHLVKPYEIENALVVYYLGIAFAIALPVFLLVRLFFLRNRDRTLFR